MVVGHDVVFGVVVGVVVGRVQTCVVLGELASLNASRALLRILRAFVDD